jgi:hypothetical protein
MTTDAYVIERGVEIPPKGNTATKFPFLLMEPGDSVWIAGMGHIEVSSSLSHARRKTGGTFTGRATAAGIRIWRTS